MADVGADMFAEVISSQMLFFRMVVKMHTTWGCTFDANGKAEMDPMKCTKMENPDKWMEANSRNFKKDTLKNMIKIVAELQAASMDDFPVVPPQALRQLADEKLPEDTDVDKEVAKYDWGTLNATVAKWEKLEKMNTDKEKFEYLNNNPDMYEKMDWAAVRVAGRKNMKPQYKQMFQLYQ